MKTLLALLIAFTPLMVSAQLNGFAVQTTISSGTIEGYYDTKTNINKYFGIPYAKPPVKELRWTAPQAPDSWNGVKMTKKFGPRAVQAPIYGDMNFRSDGISEDCLYLNVWSPAKKNLPVLVYFYGGGYRAGDGSEPRYDGESMAQKDIVVVTVNYRLGLFGFLAHPELSQETTYKGSGNYGLLDQSFALKWVKQNIGAFGGNPNQVTIAGESAGSISVSVQMASPLSKDLIAGAIGESGAAINPTYYPRTLKEGEDLGVQFCEEVGVKTIAELRAMPLADLYTAFNQSKNSRLPIVIDNYLLPSSLNDIFAAKKQAQVPLLVGWNSAEIPAGAFLQGQEATEENYLKKIDDTFKENAKKVKKLYPYSTDRELIESATALASDQFIVFSTWKWANLHKNNSNQPVYRYLFSKVRPPLVENNLKSALAGATVKKDPNFKPPAPVGAGHASEIEYCMGNLSICTEYAWRDSDHAVSATMQNYFANFIKTGNPNGNNNPNWPVLPNYIDINDVTELKKADDSRYQFLNTLYGNK